MGCQERFPEGNSSYSIKNKEQLTRERQGGETDRDIEHSGQSDQKELSRFEKMKLIAYVLRESERERERLVIHVRVSTGGKL